MIEHRPPIQPSDDFLAITTNGVDAFPASDGHDPHVYREVQRIPEDLVHGLRQGYAAAEKELAVLEGRLLGRLDALCDFLGGGVDGNSPIVIQQAKHPVNLSWYLMLTARLVKPVTAVPTSTPVPMPASDGSPLENARLLYAQLEAPGIGEEDLPSYATQLQAYATLAVAEQLEALNEKLEAAQSSDGSFMVNANTWAQR